MIKILKVWLEINFNLVPPGGPRSVVAEEMGQADATERVPPVLKHALNSKHSNGLALGIWSFAISNFEFVSKFEIRILNFSR